MNRSLTPFDVAVFAGGSFALGLATHPAVYTDPLAHAPLVAIWTVAVWALMYARPVALDAMEDATDRLVSRIDGGDEA